MKSALTFTLLFSTLMITSFKTFGAEKKEVSKGCTLFYGDVIKALDKNKKSEKDQITIYLAQGLLEKGYGFTDKIGEAGSILEFQRGMSDIDSIASEVYSEQTFCEKKETSLVGRVIIKHEKGENEKYFYAAPCLKGLTEISHMITVNALVDEIPVCL